MPNNSMHKFQFTWYGFVCLDDNKNILIDEDFYNRYFLMLDEDVVLDKVFGSVLDEGLENYKKIYITPKNIYNFCKSLIHYKVKKNILN